MVKNIKRFKHLVLLITILISIFFIILFNTFARLYVKENAVASLNEERYTEKERQKNFDVFYLSEKVIEFGSDYPVELELFNYVEMNLEQIDFEYIYRYHDGDYDVYFYLTEELHDGDESLYSINYVNVYPIITIINNVNLILVLTFILINIFVFIIIQRTSKILELNEKQTKDFFANASHELKTPIMAIEGYAEGIEEGIVDTNSSVTTIIQECERMKRLVDDILEISKVDSGSINLEIHYQDVREIIYDVLTSILPLAKEKNIDIVFDLEEPIMVDCDDKLLYSIFSNIIGNNIRYAKSKVNISHEQIENTQLFYISDDGDSLNEENLNYMFNRFYKGEFGQTGLGLSLSREYARIHGGDIEVKSNSNEKTFIISIPNKQK